MGFYHLLKENHYDWDKAKNIFYGMTDIQIMWLNEVLRQEADRAEEASRKDARGFGKPGVEMNKKSFDLRG